MKKKINIILSCILIAAFTLVAMPVNTQAAVKKVVKSVSVSKSSLSMKTGDNTNVKVTVKAVKKVSAKDLKIKVKTSNKKVAEVKIKKAPKKSAKSGISTIQIIAKGKGTATITVTSVNATKKGKKISKKITVKVTKKNSSSSTTPTDNSSPSDNTKPTDNNTPSNNTNPSDSTTPTVSSKVVWTVTEEKYMGAAAYKDPDTGRQDSIPKELTRKYVSFNPWPTTVEQVKYVIDNCQDPYVVGALYIVALDNYEYKGLGNYSGVVYPMLDAIMSGGGTVTGSSYALTIPQKQKLADYGMKEILRTDGTKVKPTSFASRAYLKGATPENNYTPEGGMTDKTKWKIVMDTYVYCGDLDNGYITVCPQRYSLEQETAGGPKVHIEHWQGIRIGMRQHSSKKWLPTDYVSLNTKPTGNLVPYDVTKGVLFSNNYVAPVEDQGF